MFEYQTVYKFWYRYRKKMDHDEDRNYDAGNSNSNSPMRNEETGEIEQAYSRYRPSEELFASDEESDVVSVGNVSSDESSDDDTMHNIDHEVNNHSVSEHLDSIQGFDNCNEEIPCLLDDDRQTRQQEIEDLESKFDELLFEDKFLFYEPSDYRNQNLESAAEREESSSTSPQASTSQHSNVSSHFAANAESSDWAAFRSPHPGTCSMIPSPISSTHINLENSQSSQAHPNSNTSQRTDTHMPEFISSSTLFVDRLPRTPSPSFDTPYDIIRRNVARFWEHSNPSSHNIHCRCQRSNTCICPSASERNTTDVRHSQNPDLLEDIRYSHRSEILMDDLPNSDNHEEKLMRSWEGPSTSTHDILSTKEPQYECSFSCNKNTCSLPDLPSTSKISPGRISPSFSQNPTCAPKSVGKLTFHDSDTSSKDSKENCPPVKNKLVRKLSDEKKELRKRRKTSHLSESSENLSNLPKTDNDENVSENTHFSLSSGNSDEKSSKPKESETVSSVLCSSETINTEIFEASQSSRKRHISDAKTSDSDESDVKSKQKKKLKQCDSSDKEIK